MEIDPQKFIQNTKLDIDKRSEINEDEDIDDCAIREVLEETGINIK